MNLRFRAVLASAAAIALGTLLLTQGAEAQEEPSLTVTPSIGLVTGQLVTVVADGFPYQARDLLQCPADVDLGDFTHDYGRCGGTAAPFSNGVPLGFTVLTTQPTFAVVVGVPGPTTLTC